MRPWRRTTVTLLVAVLALSAWRPVAAQPSAAARRTASWTIARDPFVDLWFHCLALVGYEGYGPLSLYDARYVEQVRAEKRRAGLASILDARADELRAVFARDSAFEVLHFVPLYFVGQEPLIALRELRRGVESPTAPTSAAARLIAGSLTTPRERAAFLSLIRAAEDEWGSYLRDRRSLRTATDNREVEELRAVWAQRFARPLAAYFGSMNIGGVAILVSPSVGRDGRFVHDPTGSALVVVSSNRNDMANAPLLASVRELTYPLLDRLHAPLTRQTSRVAAARARDAAAVRAGALLLDAADSQLAAEYRRHFLQLTTSRSFDSAYPIDGHAELELRELIAATFRDVAQGRSSYENR